MVIGALAPALPRAGGGGRGRHAPATSSSAACTRRPASTTPTTTSRAAAGARRPTTTATTRSSSRTATAATRRSRSSRRATRCEHGRVQRCIHDSGGAGRHRGGLGTRRILRIGPGAEVTANALFDRTKREFGAWGLDGGGTGAAARSWSSARGDDRVPHLPGGLRHGVAVEVHEHRPGASGDEVLIDVAGRRRLRRPARARPRAVAPRRRRGLRLRASARELYGWEG